MVDSAKAITLAHCWPVGGKPSMIDGSIDEM